MYPEIFGVVLKKNISKIYQCATMDWHDALNIDQTPKHNLTFNWDTKSILN